MSQVELNRLLALGAIPPNKVRLVNRGRAVPVRTWATEENGASVVNGKQIGLLIGKGCTLTISEIERSAYGLFALCSGLQAELSYSFRANIYLTPPFAQGFNAHFDDHDVIVLQLEGEKDWQVFERSTEEPDQAENVTLAADQRPIIQVRLRKGDSLYIPRGFVHCAASAEQPSLHASIGIYPVTVADLLSYAVNELAESPELARPLQPGFAHRPEDLHALVAEGLRALSAQLDDYAGANEVARAFCRI